ncbi:CdaR family protein [Desulfobulbus elongatus]|uniref:CdaR family protein n=1 Tax=Desulfobulbus elongatus TaxID=53332 RepID=UPI000685BBFB|nr:CdaR family protein [Desulfobulbus elongatus]
MIRTPDLSFLSKHWLLKLLSLLIGASLWYFVVAEDRLDLTVTIPLELRNLPANLVIGNQYKKDIEVVVSGPRRLIQEMRQQNISRPVDLSKAEPGPMVVKNDEDSIPLPGGIAVQRVQPANITLLIDRLARKDFPITPVTKGKPAAGFVFESLTLNPPQITVTGPQTVLEKENVLKTSLIDLDGLDGSGTFQVHLDLNEALLKLIGETVIEANVTLKEIMLRKTVRGIPVGSREPETPAKFAPATVTVEADIPERIVQVTPELATLFRASAGVSADRTGNEVPVQVRGVSLPGHTPIVIHTVTPDKVRMQP